MDQINFPRADRPTTWNKLNYPPLPIFSQYEYRGFNKYYSNIMVMNNIIIIYQLFPSVFINLFCLLYRISNGRFCVTTK